MIEDNSEQAPSTLLTNLRVTRHLSKDLDLSSDVFNLANRKVNDIEYVYQSQLASEVTPSADLRHVHPAEPRTLRVTLQARF